MLRRPRRGHFRDDSAQGDFLSHADSDGRAPRGGDAETATQSAPDPHSGRQLRRRALGGFIWLSLANAIRGVLRVAILAVLGRLLLPADFGLLAAAGSVLWFLNIFSSVGVGPALVQRPEIEERHVHAGWTASIAGGLLLGVVAYLAAPEIAVLFRMPPLARVIQVMALAIPVAAVSSVSEALLQRELRFRALARIDLVSYAIGYGIVGTGLAWWGAGVWALVAAELSKTVLRAVLLAAAAPHRMRVSFHGPSVRELVGFGSGYTAAWVSTYFALEGDNLVIARTLGTVALGLYGRAYELMLVPAKALGEILSKVLFAALSKIQSDRRQLGDALRRGIALVALLVVPVSVATVILAPEIIRLLLGPRWDGAIVPLRILAAAMYFQIGYMVGQSVANAAGAVYAAAWRTAVYAVLVVLGAVVGQHWGIAGVAVGVAIAITLNFVLISQLALRLTALPVRTFAAVHVPALVLGGTGGVVLWGVAGTLRGMGASAGVVLVAAVASALAWALVLLRVAAGRLLGADGLWMLTTILDRAPRSLRPALGWALHHQLPE